MVMGNSSINFRESIGSFTDWVSKVLSAGITLGEEVSKTLNSRISSGDDQQKLKVLEAQKEQASLEKSDSKAPALSQDQQTKLRAYSNGLKPKQAISVLDRELDLAKADASRQVVLTEPFPGGKATFVNQHQYQIGKLDAPLVTNSLAPCSALVIIDPKSHQQFLAHIDTFTKVSDITAVIKKSFPQLSDEASIYIVKGSMASPTEKNIYQAVKNAGYAQKVKFVEAPEGKEPHAVAVKDGKLYSYNLGCVQSSYSTESFPD